LFRLTPPSEAQVRHFISGQADSGFSYPEVGRSANAIPSGYNVDHNRIQIGRGALIWQRAVEAIRAWQMFSMPWVRLYWPSAPIKVGAEVAVLMRHFGFYSLNACRIVYVVDENARVKRFGFAYGTLKEHAQRGEERFMVEWNRDEDQVWYDILAFSRPREMLARLGYPLARSLQKKFGEESKRAMRAVVSGL
jgi:uncharacterized protein (UPF0548 family)